MGLGCLDKLGGAVMGFLQGALLVTVCVLVTVAFFPAQQWLAEARLPGMFSGAFHLSSTVSPGELGDRVRDGVKHWNMGHPNGCTPVMAQSDEILLQSSKSTSYTD